MAKFLQSGTRVILLNICLLKSFHSTVPKQALQLGNLDFCPYKHFEDPWDTLVQQWLKSLIAASGFENSLTERV